jgi:hypothetical protein
MITSDNRERRDEAMSSQEPGVMIGQKDGEDEARRMYTDVDERTETWRGR